MNDWAGTDLTITDDIQFDNTGDYAAIAGKENVDASIIRRLLTPRGALFYDGTYGNQLFDILGDPVDSEFISKAKRSIEECLLAEPRIKLYDVNVVTDEERKVSFSIAYKYKYNGISATMGGEITDAGIII